jgi:hypothetical protein
MIGLLEEAINAEPSETVEHQTKKAKVDEEPNETITRTPKRKVKKEKEVIIIEDDTPKQSEDDKNKQKEKQVFILNRPGEDEDDEDNESGEDAFNDEAVIAVINKFNSSERKKLFDLLRGANVGFETVKGVKADEKKEINNERVCEALDELEYEASDDEITKEHIFEFLKTKQKQK